jgi:hypothetical protein
MSDNVPTSPQISVPFDQTLQNESLRKVIDSTAQYGSKAVILRALSTDAARVFLDASLDFCYIDAQHDYYSALEDILAWWPKVRSGGK